MRCYIIRVAFVVAVSLAGLWLLDWLYPPQLPGQQGDFATVVLDQDGVPMRAFADNKGIWRYQVTLDQVSPLYIEALLHYEDRYFYQHPGVNPFSIVRATWQWFSSGRVISGGSTLSMQVARILHPHQRTLWGKSKQMLRALQLEWHLSKQQILELYLNYAPFGGTIEGVQAASLQYLNKPASALRHSEAALLTVLPQAPTKLRPDRHPDRARQYRDKVLQRLLANQVWPEAVVQSALQEQVAVWPLRNAVVAPILARNLHQQYSKQRVIHTTIDRNLQSVFADVIKRYTAPLGVEISAAALLVDNHSLEVKAYVGSADFMNQRRAGYVDMVKAIRSPGSTLKPFLFALALDKQLIHSESLMADVPRYASGYRPGNFSGGFSGPVAISEALQRSLNLPFVQLIEAYGAQDFANALSHVGARLKVPGGKASPAIMLGGTGTSLESLVTLYSGLANRGTVSPLRYLKNQPAAGSRVLLSPEAAWITWDVLRKIEKPFSHRQTLSNARLPEFAWKTGTSWDFRDVWAIGTNRNYTLGVWLGRPDGKPMQKTSGRILAGPLLFNLLALLEHPDEGAIAKPDGVTLQKICWPDGRAVFSVELGCDRVRSALAINGVTPRTLKRKPVKGDLFFNPIEHYLTNETGRLRVSRGCAKGTVHIAAVSLWPVALEPWLKAKERRRYRLPDYANDCNMTAQKEAQLRLIGVKEGEVFHTNMGGGITLKIQVPDGSADNDWYLNGELIQSGSDHVQLQLKQKDNYEVFVHNKSGATGVIRFRII